MDHKPRLILTFTYFVWDFWRTVLLPVYRKRCHSYLYRIREILRLIVSAGFEPRRILADQQEEVTFDVTFLEITAELSAGRPLVGSRCGGDDL